MKNLPLLVIVFVLSCIVLKGNAAPGDASYSGPASGVKITERKQLVNFAKDAPPPDSKRELRLVLKDAITLTDVEKQGIKGGGGVRSVQVQVYGNIVLLLPVSNGAVDYEAASGEITYLGVNRIGFKGPVRENPANPLKIEGNRASGSLLFSGSLKEPHREEPRKFALTIDLDLTISEEKFGYTPDPDPSIPPWRVDKTQPSGFKVAGTWRTVEKLPDKQLELEGKIGGSRGCYRIAATNKHFFPVQAIDAEPVPGGMRVTAYAANKRVDANNSQWMVRLLDEPVDLRRFNGLRLVVESEKPAPGKPITAGVAVAFRVKGQPWFACRTVAPLLGGEQDHVVDFDFFARGTANPGFGSGPNVQEFPDLSQIDAIAVGMANPFGVGDVTFTVKELEAVRHAERGAGEAPTEAVTVSVDAARRDVFNEVDTVPKGLFGYHLANSSFQSKDPAPAFFDAPPINGDVMRLLELTRPGSLRPLDHTNFSAETGASMVHLFPAELAKKADALDNIMHTITNENLWARPKWMDVDPDQYADGIREMFRQLGKVAWTPDKPDNTLRRIEFWNEPFMWARHINRGQSTVSAGPGDPGGNRGRKAWNDPTQFTFMPGKLGGEMYSKFFNAAAEGLAETNPHVAIGGMSSGAFNEDFYSQLTNYVAHFMEGSKDHIHFLTEHHYSGHAPSFAAGYEVATAWSLAKHGKRWPIWNTEANDLDDVAPGDRRSAEAAKAFTDQNRAYYNYRDILEMIRYSRDKAAGRAIHALWGRGWFKNEGEQLMYLHTAALRGTLVVTDSSDATIIPIGAVSDNRLALYILNDSPFPRPLRIKLKGIGPAAVIVAEGLRLADDASKLAVYIAEFSRDGELIQFKKPIAPREILKVTATSVPAPVGARKAQQFFADAVVVDVLPGEPLVTKISVPANAMNSAGAARLRFVAGDVQTGEARVRIGSTNVTLPATTAEASKHTIKEVSLPLEALGAAKSGVLPVEVVCESGRDGFQLYMLSLILEQR
jgi:hypothetical protein